MKLSKVPEVSELVAQRARGSELLRSLSTGLAHISCFPGTAGISIPPTEALHAAIMDHVAARVRELDEQLKGRGVEIDLSETEVPGDDLEGEEGHVDG